ncbi:zinc-ribbon domain-containing protein [Cohnella boryungensis]|uniref:Zinc-ribbon domain-containing protein n=1 Tax=Cohnella boryungensis TaxID=768479 RepID=A0ABV8S6R9_9BACL
MSFFKKITDSVSKGVTTATEKAQQTVEITKLNSQISGKRKEIDKLYAMIGESVYEGFLAHDLSTAEAKVMPRCEEISRIQEEIVALDARIKSIRNEKDCVCGKRVSEDTRFCPSCGHPFPAPEPVVPEEEPIQAEPQPADEEAAEEAGATAVELEKSEASRADQRQVCVNCGTPLYGDSHYCPACGQSTR